MHGSAQGVLLSHSYLITIYHALVVAYYLIIDVCMAMVSVRLYETGHPVTQMFLGGCTQFFTSWNQVFQQSYFILSLVEGLLRYSTCKHHAHTCQTIAVFRQRIFGPILLPSACLTVVNFWMIYWLVPHLMFDDLVAFYPGFLNHAMHTFVMPLAFSELFLAPKESIPFRTGFSDVTLLMAAYAGWIYSLGWLTNQWPYPFLEAMSGPMHILFVPCMFLHGYLWFNICHALIRTLWGTKEKVMKIN